MIVQRQKKDGTTVFMVRVDAISPKTGRRTMATIGTFTSRRKAETAERQAIVARDAGTTITRSTQTVAQLLDDWFAAKRHDVSPNTARLYEIAIERHLKPALGSIPVQKLTAADIQRTYTRWRDAKVGTRTILVCHQRLVQALAMAERHGTVSRNVATLVTPPRDRPKRIAPWTAAQCRVFLDKAKDDGYHPVWHLLLCEGLRRGEALGLRWRDVDIETGIARIRQTAIVNLTKADADPNRRAVTLQDMTKTKAGTRTVRLTTGTLTVLREHKKKQTERYVGLGIRPTQDLVVTSQLGTVVNPNNLTRAMERLIQDADLPRLTVHGLRHVAATLLVASGIDLRTVADRLGHANASVTLDKYSHIVPDAQERAVAALDDLLGKTGS